LVIQAALIVGDKGLTQSELHILDAEITSLRDRLGLSHKDSAHRLYMAEVERLKKADSATKFFATLRQRINCIVDEDICLPIQSIDKGESDDYILKDRKWESKHGREE
jgi:hypothetical protein